MLPLLEDQDKGFARLSGREGILSLSKQQDWVKLLGIEIDLT